MTDALPTEVTVLTDVNVLAIALTEYCPNRGLTSLLSLSAYL